MSRLPRAEIAVPLTILVAAILLAVSELMTTFQLTQPGGEAISDELASDRHGWAMLVLAAFAVGSVVVATLTGQRVAALAAAAFGLAALAIFLIVDLPDVNGTGDVSDPEQGLTTVEAIPQLGFWLEAISAVTLAIGGIAYATFSPTQLRYPKRIRES